MNFRGYSTWQLMNSSFSVPIEIPTMPVILMGARSIILYIHLRTFSSGAAAMRDLCMAGNGALYVVRISGFFCRVVLRLPHIV